MFPVSPKHPCCDPRAMPHEWQRLLSSAVEGRPQPRRHLRGAKLPEPSFFEVHVRWSLAASERQVRGLGRCCNDVRAGRYSNPSSYGQVLVDAALECLRSNSPAGSILSSLFVQKTPRSFWQLATDTVLLSDCQYRDLPKRLTQQYWICVTFFLPFLHAYHHLLLSPKQNPPHASKSSNHSAKYDSWHVLHCRFRTPKNSPHPPSNTLPSEHPPHIAPARTWRGFRSSSVQKPLICLPCPHDVFGYAPALAFRPRGLGSQARWTSLSHQRSPVRQRPPARAPVEGIQGELHSSRHSLVACEVTIIFSFDVVGEILRSQELADLGMKAFRKRPLGASNRSLAQEH